MPRIVDHEERRQELAVAVWDVVSEYGLEQLTFRRVADRSGWTTGVVQHYFPTKQALVVYAFDLVQSRSRKRLAEAALTRNRAARARSLVAALLPLDESRRTESRVWLAFLGAAASDAELNAVAEAGRDDFVAAISAAVSDVIGDAADAGAAEDLAVDLIAIADGINVAAVYSQPPMAVRQMTSMLGRMVDARLRASGVLA